MVPVASSDTALWVRGASRVDIPIDDVLMRVPPGYSLERIDYPAGLWPWTGLDTATGAQSIAVGVPILDAAMQAAQGQGQTLVIGESLGSLVVDQQLRELTARPDAPDPATVRVLVIAPPGRPGGLLSYLPVGAYEALTGTTIKPVPETPYDVTVLKLQYDAIANWPDRPWHLLAVLNAIAGGIYFHASENYSEYAQDIVNGRTPPGTVTTTVNSQGGVTTTYTVQQTPALLYPLEPIFPEAVAAVNKVLTPIINLGYSELTPDAGPHLAPGGQLVDMSGTPVFPPPAEVRAAETQSPDVRVQGTGLPEVRVPENRPRALSQTGVQLRVSPARTALSAAAERAPSARGMAREPSSAGRGSTERVSARTATAR